jgi:cytochrome c
MWFRQRPPRGVVPAIPLLILGCLGAGSRSAQTVAGGEPARGAGKIEAYGCGSCHAISGVDGATGTAGPPLVWFGRQAMIAGVISNTPDHLIAWIIDPQAIKSGTVMPNLGVQAADARDIAAYLYSQR